jgi:nucleoside-diphosphate-sugar epimerase
MHRTRNRTALIAGASGIVGSAAVVHFAAEPDWDVIALSRRAGGLPHEATHLAVDLADPTAIAAAASRLEQVTHLFYAAYTPRPALAEECAVNTAMLVNLVEAVERAAPRLTHIQLMQGSKWYGNHVGPYRTPAKEDDARHLAPCFYYDQQDWLCARQRGKAWTWSALRPHGVLGSAVGSSMNQLTAVALYAAISKELGLPLRFPGRPGAFTCAYQMTDARLLARAMQWSATSDATVNQPFNVTNGDVIRWCHLWPRIASFFGMPEGPVQTISLAEFMADKEPLWAEMRARHGLADHNLAELTNWRFADFVLGSDYDQISALTKFRQAGWRHSVDSEETYVGLLAMLRAQRIIP